MSLGLGIILIVIGAVLSFALNLTVGAVDLDVIGYILIAAGVVVSAAGLTTTFRKRSSITTVRTSVNPASGESITSRESQTHDNL